MRACVIFNPAARGQKAERFCRHLDFIASECEFKLTAAAGDARRLATIAVAEGFETIIAAGGDGTVNEVLNGLTDAPGGLARARLGVLPLGTANVFARELGLPLRPEAAWAALRRGNERRIDLPLVEYDEAGQRHRRHFAQLAGAGLDARAIQLVDWSQKKRVGPLAYIVAGLRAMAETHPPLTVSDGARSVTGQLVLIGNGRLYGGPFRVFPQADLADGRLDVCVFPRVNWGVLARCGLRLLWRRTLPEPVLVRWQADAITLACEAAVSFEIDGEPGRPLPAKFTVQRAALRVLIS